MSGPPTARSGARGGAQSRRRPAVARRWGRDRSPASALGDPPPGARAGERCDGAARGGSRRCTAADACRRRWVCALIAVVNAVSLVGDLPSVPAPRRARVTSHMSSISPRPGICRRPAGENYPPAEAMALLDLLQRTGQVLAGKPHDRHGSGTATAGSRARATTFAQRARRRGRGDLRAAAVLRTRDDSLPAGVERHAAGSASR